MIDFDDFRNFYLEKCGLPLSDQRDSTPLFHYTDNNGLIGILNGKELWATHFGYLNDSSEIRWGIDIFFDEVRKRYKDVDNSDLHENINKFEHIVRTSQLPNFYIFCMSSENNLLNQWRYYGGDQVSYAIGINIPRIYDESICRDFYLFKMIYAEDEQRKICNSVINALEAFVDQKHTELSTDEAKEDFMRQASVMLVMTLMRLKNSAFEAEKEWRIVVRDPNVLSENVKFRPGKYGLIPYIPMKNVAEETNIPIEQIVVGPGRFSAMAYQSLQMFLASKHLNDISLSYSVIPIR